MWCEGENVRRAIVQLRHKCLRWRKFKCASELFLVLRVHHTHHTMSSSDSNQNESKKPRVNTNENKKQEEGSSSVVNHDLYNNQHYNLALARRNLNARLKPSVFPSRNSPVTGVQQHANGSHTKDTNKDNHSEMDALTRRRLLNQLPPRSNSSLATGGPIEQQHHVDREKSSESTTTASSSIPSGMSFHLDSLFHRFDASVIIVAITHA